ncbi:methionyl-tRNA formyltransferase [Rhodoferax saidenbachensis]|uniref:Methionyl-tRNA formyltransferase n=1 Tax=Rhodoferax saidenbachensis TaxID=1484693 RepID=A0A1P8KG91_9BURK|nr:methionyl-tRNA formyltransferase [Rhodoferax saidenbachensis]
MRAVRPLRVIFAGTPEFARVALERLHAAGHTIALVLSQPDRPAGRGMKLQASAVKQFALEHAIPVAQPRSLRLDGKYPEDAAAARQAIADAQADVMVVAAYGLILPQWVLDDMAIGGKFGCLNIHGSLLPRWRGAAPIHRAIEVGDAETGVTIMQMDVGLDTGDMLLKQSLPIADTDTTATLHDKVADLGATLVVQALDLAAQGTLRPVKQPEEGVTYAHKIEKHEAPIDWRLDAAAIVRRVRAFNPFPGASTVLNGEVIKVWGAHVLTPGWGISVISGKAIRIWGERAGDDMRIVTPPKYCGEITALAPEGIAVASMNSVVILTELQRPGGKRLPAAEFLRGCPLQVGQRFELPAAPEVS